MARWAVEVDLQAHGEVRSVRVPRLTMPGVALRGPTVPTPMRGGRLGTRSDKELALIRVADWTGELDHAICCMHSLTATDKAGYAAGSARRRGRLRTRRVNVSPDSEHAISIRQWFAENGYPPLSEEQRRAVVLFGRVKPQGR